MSLSLNGQIGFQEFLFGFKVVCNIKQKVVVYIATIATIENKTDINYTNNEQISSLAK